MKKLYDKLSAYKDSDYYPFHMPGHKRNPTCTGSSLPYGIDITEIDGFDDLHHASGILKEAQEQAAELFHAEETHVLVNGSTAGILSAIMGSTHRGDQILAARNCHKSVYHAIEMQGLEAVYIYPEFQEELQINGEIKAEEVQELLERHPDIRAVMITSPTYDGVVSDIEAIASVVHEYSIPLIVDEAHGAHFGFHPYFPKNANQRRADIVIHSVHKTLPALTQTALIHMNGAYADRKRIRRYLDMLQTSSPSYVLMAGMDVCMDMLRTRGRELFDEYVARLSYTREALSKMSHLRCIMTDHYDGSKIIISTAGTDMTSRELYRTLLETYHLQPEMQAGSYVLAMTSIADTEEGFERLTEALKRIDASINDDPRKQPGDALPKAHKVYTSSQTAEMAGQGAPVFSKEYQDGTGYIAAEYLYLYPPGIPLVVPGERITEEITVCIKSYEKLGFEIQGTAVEGRVEVLANG